MNKITALAIETAFILYEETNSYQCILIITFNNYWLLNTSGNWATYWSLLSILKSEVFFMFLEKNIFLRLACRSSSSFIPFHSLQRSSRHYFHLFFFFSVKLSELKGHFSLSVWVFRTESAPSGKSKRYWNFKKSH